MKKKELESRIKKLEEQYNELMRLFIKLNTRFAPIECEHHSNRPWIPFPNFITCETYNGDKQ